MSFGRSFPVDVFPSIIRNAIYEAEQHTQAPLSLIAASALGAISLACQNGIDICRLNNLRSPVSLFYSLWLNLENGKVRLIRF